MKHFVALLVALVAIAPAHAALNYDGYATGPGGFSTPYPAVTPQVFAGLLQFNYGSNPVLMMSDDYTTRVNVGDSWAMHLYTYADIQAGAPVKFTPAQYARAGSVLHSYFPMEATSNSMMSTIAGVIGNDQLAVINTQVWEIFASTTVPAFMGGQSIDTYNWSSHMLVASGGLDEYLIPINTFEALGSIATIGQATIPSIPEPSSYLMFASGLLLIGWVARRKSNLGLVCKK